MSSYELIDASWAWLSRPMTLNLAAFLLTLALAQRNAAKIGLNPAVMYWAGVWGIVGALWGGHLYQLFGDPGAVLARPLLLFEFLQGRKASLGALFGAVFCACIYLRRRRASLLTYADAALPAVALGYFVARLACFSAGDDFGIATSLPWGVGFEAGSEAYQLHLQRGWIDVADSSSLRVHPTQLYHAVAGLLIFVLLSRRPVGWPGSQVAQGLILYGLTRFVIQFYRDDHGLAEAVLDSVQWFCLALMASGLALLFARTRGRILPPLHLSSGVKP